MMKPLKESYRILAMLGICPPLQPISCCKKLFQNSILILWAIGLFLYFIASLAFLIKSISIDLTSVISTIFQLSAIITALYSLTTAYIKRNELKNMFDAFQIFYDASKLKIFISIENKYLILSKINIL